MLKRAANVDIAFIPYAGDAPAVNALLGGHIYAGHTDKAHTTYLRERLEARAAAASDAERRKILAFMTLHFPDQVQTNILTIDATDPKSGTAEFKASAIRVEKLPLPQSDAAPGRVALPAR